MNKKEIKKLLLNIAIVFGDLLSGLNLIIFCILISPAFQTFLGQKMASYISTKGEVECTVGKVAIYPFFQVNIEHFYLEDELGDTLIYFNELRAHLSEYDLNKNHFYIKNVALNEFQLYFKKLEQGSNLDLFKKIFGSSAKKTNKPSIILQNIAINNSKFHFKNLPKYESKEFGMNYTDIDVYNINAFVKQGRFDQQGLELFISSLKAKEQSGVNLFYLRTLFKLNDNEMSFNHSSFYSNAGRLKGDIIFNYNSMKSMSEFSDSVQMDINLNTAKTNLKNLAYFAPILKDVNQLVILNGHAKGSIDHLSSDKLTLLWDGGITDLKLNLKHLHQSGKRKFDIQLLNCRTSAGSVKNIPMIPFDEGKKLPFPSQISDDEKLRFNGRLSGNERFLTFKGEIDNYKNTFATNITIKNESNYIDVNGVVDYKTVYLKYFLPKDFNKVYSQGNLSFQWFKDKQKNKSNLFLNMLNEKLKINEEQIDQLSAQFSWNGDVWDGKLRQNKKSSKLNLNIRYESNPKKSLRLQGEVNNLELAKLLPKYYQLNEKLAFQGAISLDLDKKNELRGKVKLNSLNLQSDSGYYEFGKVEFIAQEINGVNTMELKSNPLDFNFNGDFELNQLIALAPQLPQLFIPHNATNDIVDKQIDVDLNVNIREWEDIKALIPFEIPNIPKLSLKAKVNSNQFYTDLNFDLYEIAQFDLFKTHLTFDKKGKEGSILLEMDTLRGDMFTFKSLKYDGVYNEGIQILNNIKWNNKKNTFGQLDFALNFSDFKTFESQWNHSVICLSKDTFEIYKGAYAALDTLQMNFDRFEVQSKKSAIAINGSLAANKAEELVKIQISNFDVSELYPLYSSKLDHQFKGIFNGSLLMNHPSVADSNKVIEANFNVYNLYIDSLEIGDIGLKGEWDAMLEVIKLRGNLDQEYLKNLTFNGLYNLRDEDPLDVYLNLNKANFDFLSAFLPEVIENFQAQVDGIVHLSGSFAQPDLKGELKVEKGLIKLSNLNTSYKFQDVIHLNTNSISWKNLQLIDEEGNYCNTDALLKHHYFRNWEVDMSFKTNNIMVMDNDVKISPEYYGKLYLAGFGTYKYNSNNNILEFNGRTTKGSKFILPFEDEKLDEESGFINFVSKSSDEKEEANIKEKETYSGFEMDIKLELTPDARFELVFDEKVGEKIQGRAKGDIQLKLEKNGNFDMFGNAYIASGYYLFSFQNVINKKFDLEPGGAIKFDGDVTTGEIDVKANYKVRANLRDLSPVVINSDNNLVDNSFKNSAEVNCGIVLKRKLLNPDIDFQISFVNENVVPDEVKTALVNITSTEQERNLQFFSLLLMNRFWPKLSIDNSSNNFIGNTGSELLSNQVSNWLSSISDEVDFNFKYKPNDQFGNSELAFGFETQILNDRLIIKGTAGVANRNTGTGNEINRNLIGDFIIEYKLSENGNFRVKAFNLTNDYTVSTIDNSLYTQGIGVNYSEDFDKAKEIKLIKFFNNWFARKPEENENELKK